MKFEPLLETRLAMFEWVPTVRELEIVQLIADGRKYTEIAEQLRISPKTVEGHRAAAMRKLSLTTKADLVRWAMRNGLVH